MIFCIVVPLLKQKKLQAEKDKLQLWPLFPFSGEFMTKKLQ